MGIIIGQFRANNEAMGIESVKPDDAEHRQRQNEMIHGGALYSRDKIYIDDMLPGKKYHISNPRGLRNHKQLSEIGISAHHGMVIKHHTMVLI